jgi:Cytidylate kinase-like family
MTLVTLSSSYAAGGSQLGPRLAERLRVPFLDRAITSEVAERLAVEEADAEAHQEQVGGLLARVVLRLAPIGAAFGAAPEGPLEEGAYVQATEATVRAHADAGDAVILGRSGALILKDHPHALHVRLDGPKERRIAQAVTLLGVDRATAARQLTETDRAREAYAQHFYRADVRDPALYHLVIDTTAIGLDTALELIVTAAAARG